MPYITELSAQTELILAGAGIISNALIFYLVNRYYNNQERKKWW